MVQTASQLKSSSLDGHARILKAAMRLFAQRGFNGVSISDVAKDARLVKSAIYHHYPSKEALYLAVLQESTRSSRDQMAAAAIGDTWLERLRGAALVVGRLVGTRSHVLSLILERMAQSSSELSAANVAAMRQVRDQFTSVIAKEIAAGVAAGDLRPIDPELGSLCLIGLIVAALQPIPENGDESYDESVVNLAVDLFLNGAVRRVK